LVLAAQARADDPLIAAAGDIACSPDSQYFNGGLGVHNFCRQGRTSNMLFDPQIDAVLTLGDTQYEYGTLSAFQASYHPSWGRRKSITRPSIGNHEYLQNPQASGYFDYFNGVAIPTGPAGLRGQGYYSFNLGAWHLIALNTNLNCRIVSCAVGSAQEQWLRTDLALNPGKCVLAYDHHPRYSSGGIGNNPEVKPLWAALYERGADVFLSGHDHNYERFRPQNNAGGRDNQRGVRQFVVGTGGKSKLRLGVIRSNSRVRKRAFGVLRMRLRADSYTWNFRTPSGDRLDSGSTACH
jgi:hypothetical protein